MIDGYDWRTNFDNDNDGCEDTTEDTDLDNDGVESQYDDCENEPSSNWVSMPDVDFDGDGCADSVDPDDDGDGVSDGVDECPLTEIVSILTEMVAMTPQRTKMMTAMGWKTPLTVAHWASVIGTPLLALI